MFGTRALRKVDKMLSCVIIKKQNMDNSQRNITKKQIILGVIFLFIGFFCSLFVFKFFTKPKPAEFTTPALPVQQPPAEVLPVTQEQKEPEVAEIVVEAKAYIAEPLVEEEEIKERVVPELVLNGIFASETGSYVLINNRIVRQGETILGVKVTHIYSNKVELDAFGKKIILRVK
ncbi:hypothetical protein ACFL2Y_00295 [Candidatus Omnitrophota bacterium]